MVEQLNERAEKQAVSKDAGSHAASLRMFDEIFCTKPLPNKGSETSQIPLPGKNTSSSSELPAPPVPNPPPESKNVDGSCTTKGREPGPGDIVRLDPIEWGGDDNLKRAISEEEFKRDSDRVEIDPIELERHPNDRISEDEIPKPEK